MTSGVYRRACLPETIMLDRIDTLGKITVAALLAALTFVLGWSLAWVGLAAGILLLEVHVLVVWALFVGLVQLVVMDVSRSGTYCMLWSIEDC